MKSSKWIVLGYLIAITAAYADDSTVFSQLINQGKLKMQLITMAFLRITSVSILKRMQSFHGEGVI